MGLSGGLDGSDGGGAGGFWVMYVSMVSTWRLDMIPAPHGLSILCTDLATIEFLVEKRDQGEVKEAIHTGEQTA